MTRRLVGAIAGGIVLLTGAWLVLAPFALGFQPSGKDWTDETLTDVWTGIGLGVVGLIGIVAFVAALRQHLVERGLVTPRRRPVAAAPAAPAQPAPEAAGRSELDSLIAPLIAAITEDINRDRQAGSNGATHAPARAEAGGGQRHTYGLPGSESREQSL